MWSSAYAPEPHPPRSKRVWLCDGLVAFSMRCAARVPSPKLLWAHLCAKRSDFARRSCRLPGQHDHRLFELLASPAYEWSVHLQHLVLARARLELWQARPLHDQRSVLLCSVPGSGPRPCDSWSREGALLEREIFVSCVRKSQRPHSVTHNRQARPVLHARLGEPHGHGKH